jgi:transcriptional regulator with XRE-family HTH domain
MYKITKRELAEAIGMSRPTLDKLLNGNCPKDIKIMIKTKMDLYYLYDTRLRLENEIKLIDKKINKLKNKN